MIGTGLKRRDFLTAVVDEIALEGLDGITIEGLWLRLKNRPLFTFPLDDYGKDFLWTLIIKNDNLQFFELPYPRKPLTIFNRYQFVDPDIGLVLDPPGTPENIYPHHLINDTVQKIKGSCFFYEERKDISSVVRNSKPTLGEAEERWGLQLVIVASQPLREYTLLGGSVDPCLEITAIRYCILERIGRSRYLGEVTQGKASLLQDVERDPKLLFYNRKFLSTFGLITKQVHHLKSNKQNCTGSLLHLPRFYVERQSKTLVFIQRVVEILRTRPNYVADFEAVRKELGMSVKFKKFFKTPHFRRFVKVDLRVPYRTLYPDAQPKEWKRKAAELEKTIRAIQLINPDLEDSDIWSKDNDLEPDPDTVTHVSRQIDLVHDRAILHQAFYAIDKAGPEGVSQLELSALMGITKLQSRTMCRNLLRLQLLSTYMNDIGRQRVTRYMSLRYIKESKLATLFHQEKDKMFSLIKKKNKHRRKKEKPNERTIDDKISKSPAKKKETTEELIRPGSSKKRKAKQSLSADAVKKLKLEAETRAAAAEGLATLSDVSLLSIRPAQDDSPAGCSKDEPGLSSQPQHGIIETKICEVDDSFYGGIDNVCGFVEEFDKQNVHTSGVKGKDSPGVTYRLLKRANLIIETVQANKVIDDLSKLIRLINEAEDKEGYIVKMDKKSLMRLLLKLNKDNNVKFIRVQLKSEMKEKMLNFVCLPNITYDHAIIQSVIEQEKLKFFVVTREKLSKNEEALTKDLKENDDSGLFDEQITESLNELKAMSLKQEMKCIPDRSAARKYGYSPKFLRMRMLHQFLFYLIHDYRGDRNLDQTAAVEELQKHGANFTQQDIEELPTIYQAELSWKTFVPPLPKHPGWPTGWAVVCDVLLRIPLSIFTKVFNVGYKIPNLLDYLSHPTRRHFLLKNLPPEMRSSLMLGRKYIFSFHELVQRLCFIGVAQYGPQRLKEKDQVFIYMNQRASLLDTTTSEPGYHKISENIEYPRKTYLFAAGDDLEKYWYELWNICLHTRLGGRLCMIGQNIVLENLVTKPAMIDTLQVRSPYEAASHDLGEIPGDHMGAAGLDSALFSHLKRNWNWTNAHVNEPNSLKQPGKNLTGDILRRNRLANVKTKPILFRDILTASTSGEIQWTPAGNKRTGPHKAKPIRRLTRTVTSKTPVVRTFLPTKKGRKNRPWYDEVDKKTESGLNRQRVRWSQEEDDLLLLCKVGMVYICPNARKQVITYHAVRDVVHATLNASRNKTSRACQRRMLVMMKSKAAQRNVALLLEEVKHDQFITTRFQNSISEAREKTKNLDAIEYLVCIKFKCLVKILGKKFSRKSLLGENVTHSNHLANYAIIPDTPQDFLAKNEVVHPPHIMKKRGTFPEAKTIGDIHCATVTAFVHSTLCSLHDKTSYMYDLFKIYQQYPDSILRTVMTKLRADHMVSLRKSYVKMLHKSGNYLPVSSLPYQLSVSYFFTLQTSYEFELFEECYQIRNSLLQYSSRSESNTSLSTDSEMGYRSDEHDGGTAASIVEMFCLDRVTLNLHIPDNIVILDPHLGKTDEAYMKILARYQDIVRSCTLTKAVPLSSTLYSSPTFLYPSSNKIAEAKEDVEEVPEKIQPSKGSANGGCRFDVGAIGKFSLPNEDEDSSGLEDFSDEEVEKEKEELVMAPLTKSTQYTIARAASRIALFTMRDDFVFSNPGPTGETQHAHDFLVVNSCKVFCEMRRPDAQRPNRFEFVGQEMEPIARIDSMGKHGREVSPDVSGTSQNQELAAIPKEEQNAATMIEQFTEILNDLKSSTTVSEDLVTEEEARQIFIDSGGSQGEWDQAYTIVQHIQSKQEVGATTKDLREIFSDLSCDKTLADLLILVTATNLVHRMGVSQYHYVHQLFIKPWLLHSFKRTRLQHEKLQAPVNLAPDSSTGKRRRSSGTEDRQDLLKPRINSEDGSVSSMEATKVIEDDVVLHSTSESVDDVDISKTTVAAKEVKIDSPVASGSPNQSETVASADAQVDSVLAVAGPSNASSSLDEQVSGGEILATDKAKLLETPFGTYALDETVAAANEGEKEKVRVKVCPWVRIDGLFNRRVFDRMLGSVLSFCLCEPGASVTRIQTRFSPALQPFHTLELIEFLNKLGCLKLQLVLAGSKATLFSKMSPVTIKDATVIEDESKLAVKVAVDAITRLSTFIGDKAYKKDFLSAI